MVSLSSCAVGLRRSHRSTSGTLRPHDRVLVEVRRASFPGCLTDGAALLAYDDQVRPAETSNLPAGVHSEADGPVIRIVANSEASSAALLTSVSMAKRWTP